MNLRQELTSRVEQALVAAGAPEGTPALVGPAKDPRFGDYQANGVMAAAKQLKTHPRELAETVVANLDLADLAEPPDVAGPGFINITLKPEFLSVQLAAASADEHLGVARPDAPQTVVVDYSSPNLAKEMHVGHLRSTIIGDALGRVLDFCGHRVIRQNHVGDWGTQFGMLLLEMKRAQLQADAHALDDLEGFYRQAKAHFDEDASFAEDARREVVSLQQGTPESLDAWSTFTTVSLQHCQSVYERLGVLLRADNVRGESAYNNDLPDVIEALAAKGLLTESDGAMCVFLDSFRGKGADDADLPLIVKKTDGGYLYATTDLAAIRYRVGELNADRVLYVTDSRQGQHFAMVFETATLAGFAPPGVSLEHVPFGMMLGDDRKPFKTRDGGTVKLMDLLDEAEQRTEQFIRDRRAENIAAGREPLLSEDAIPRAASAVGISAVKYADLSQNRNSDYVFSWDKMLSLEGNTAPYMQYAYTRVQSIFRKDKKGDGSRFFQALNSSITETTPVPFFKGEPTERTLGVKLLQFPETIDAVARECLPNILCAYLFELAGAFMSFYEACPVLQADDAERDSRLALCELTARTIRTGLHLLGIETLEQM